MKNILLSLLLLLTLPLFAQRIVGGSGAAGIIILLEGKLPKGEAAVLKRREAGATQFTFSKTLELAKTSQEILENGKRVPLVFRDALTINDTLARVLLQKSRNAQTVEEIPLGTATNIQLALGIGFADTTVLPGLQYEYFLELGGKLQPEKLSIRHTPDPRRIIWQPRADQSSVGVSQVKCSWSIPAEKRKDVYSFLVFRSEAFKLKYEAVACMKGFSSNGDTLLAVMRDSTLKETGVWHYVIRSVSRFGELGPVSDYVQVANFPVESDPFMPFLEAEGEEKGAYIRLNWRLKNPQRVQSLALYRSRHASKDFQLVGRFSAADSTWRDPVDVVMESYFYYFEILDVASEKPLRSPLVTGVSKFRPSANAPRNLRVENNKEAVVLRWDANSSNARGYYVYRTEGYGDNLEPVSGFLPLKPGTYEMEWSDTASTLLGDREYSYAVLAESHGYVKSALSETVRIRPARKVFIAAPTGLYLVKTDDRQYKLFWKDQSESGEKLQGYRVYKVQKSKFEVLSDKLLPLDQNYFELSDLRDGDSVTVSAVGIFGHESSRAVPVALHDPAQHNFGPRYLKCYNETDGVRITWNRPRNENLKNYKLYRSNGQDKPLLLQSLAAITTTFTDKTTRKGETYYYFIVGEDAAGNFSRGSEPAVVSR